MHDGAGELPPLHTRLSRTLVDEKGDDAGESLGPVGRPECVPSMSEPRNQIVRRFGVID